MFAIDLSKFAETPLKKKPFQYLIVPEFVKAEARLRVDEDFPSISKAGSFPVSMFRSGAAFATLLRELQSVDMRKAFEAKFGIDLKPFPTAITVRGWCGTRDGHIHTDLPSKIITVLVYLNRSWQGTGGCLRLLRSAHDLDDVLAEVPPVEGTLLAFRRSDCSFHGHKPFIGERRVIQLNWVTRRHHLWLRCQELALHIATQVGRPWSDRPALRSREATRLPAEPTYSN